LEYRYRVSHLEESRLRFIADENVGKLARRLRLLGFDTLFFKGEDDGRMVEIARTDHRIIVTRDTRVLERKPIVRGQVKAILVTSDEVEIQTQSIVAQLNLKSVMRLFTLCLECNHFLVRLDREAARERVPAYVWQTQNEYVECPECRRVYWKGTHWSAMRASLIQMNIIEDERDNERRDEIS
jgi:uncharacterized protein